MISGLVSVGGDNFAVSYPQQEWHRTELNYWESVLFQQNNLLFGYDVQPLSFEVDIPERYLITE